MSQENVEVVRTVFDAYARGVPAEELTDYIATDIVWNPADEEWSRGIGTLSDYMQRWENEWETLETTAREFLDAKDRVLVTVYFRGRGKSSGIEVDATLYEVYTLSDGKIIRMDEFTERSEALEAVGLSE